MSEFEPRRFQDLSLSRVERRASRCLELITKFDPQLPVKEADITIKDISKFDSSVVYLDYENFEEFVEIDEDDPTNWLDQ